MPLTEEGWRILTLRWGVFFLGLAILNEIIWRTQSNNVWVAFKFPGVVIIIFLFTIAQVPLMMKHELKDANTRIERHIKNTSVTKTKTGTRITPDQAR